MGSLMQMTVALWLAAAAVDPQAVEQQAKQLEAKLMAPCCWAQQVSLHQSPAADDIKRNIRRLLAEGKTSQQILDTYVAEYGDRILAEPPARGFSRLIYVAPWVFLAGSVGLVVVVIRRLRAVSPAPAKAEAAAAAPPNEDESDRIDEELRNLE
jgi:cytochrome c-type biogenesis protein CcmH